MRPRTVVIGLAMLQVVILVGLGVCGWLAYDLQRKVNEANANLDAAVDREFRKLRRKPEPAVGNGGPVW